jgi:glycosyltransferase involved in cell wall biosynthesis
MDISVIIRVHNDEKSVKKAIDSAIFQTLSNNYYEVLVIADSITNEVKQILSSYGDKIKIVFFKKLGSIKAINEGIKLCKGDYYILLDSDDFFMPQTLERMSSKIGNNIFIYGDYYEKIGRDINYFKVGKNLFNTIGGGILFRKKDVINAGLYDENLIFPEYDLIKKLIKNNVKISYIEEPLYVYVRRKDSTTSNKEIVKKGIKQLEEKYGKLPIRGY